MQINRKSNLSGNAFAKRITILLNGVSIHSSNVGKFQYKGSMVLRSIKKVAVHVLDRMRNLFWRMISPNVKASIKELVHLPYDQKYKSKYDEPADHFYFFVIFTYQNGSESITSDYIGVDNVYLKSQS